MDCEGEITHFLWKKTPADPWQLFDELNMIYTTCLMLWASLSHFRPLSTQIFLAVALVVFCIFVTLYYHYLQDPTFHQNVYAALTCFIVIRACWTMESSLRPRLRGTTEADRARKQRSSVADVPTATQQRYENERDLTILRQMWTLVVFGVTIFLSGFAIWGLDNKYCADLRRWRRHLGLPWGVLLEGHGWWHLMTGIGAYCYIVWGIWLRRVLNGQQEQYRIHWPRLWTLPEIVKVEEDEKGDGMAMGNGGWANGAVKKKV